MRYHTHTHTCRSCHDEFACGADLFQNYDGWPEMCEAQTGGRVPECETCSALPMCDWCGERMGWAPLELPGLHLCSWICHEDSEGAEPNGRVGRLAYRGGDFYV